MRRLPVGVAMLTALGASARAEINPPAMVHVDCASAPGGDGSANSPAHSLTAGVAIAKTLSADHSVTIQVADGVCDHETLPIAIDFPVTIRGEGADDDQPGGPLITWTPPSPLPPNLRSLAFFSVTARDVRISQLTIDGKLDPGPNTNVDPPRPTGLALTMAAGFELSKLLVERLGEAIRLEASSGSIRDCSLENVARGLFAGGGNPGNPTVVVVKNNRVDYRVNGLVAAGSVLGSEVRLEIINNVVTTRFTGTGPTNPAGIRISPSVPSPIGTVTAVIKGNQVLGGKYGIMLHGGQPFVSAGVTWTGQLTIELKDNHVEAPIPSLITFTNARATVLPCELTAIPPTSPSHCALALGVPPAPIPWDYLAGARFVFSHTGELDGALIDHPELHPVTGRVLGNALEINQQLIAYETFVVVPPFP